MRFYILLAIVMGLVVADRIYAHDHTLEGPRGKREAATENALLKLSEVLLRLMRRLERPFDLASKRTLGIKEPWPEASSKAPREWMDVNTRPRLRK
jgi:hypothetical protein